MQTKNVNVDGVELTIAQLNVDQVEEILYGEKPPSPDGKWWNARAWRTIEESLNNTQRDSNGDLPPGSVEVDVSAIKRRLSFGGFKSLLAIVMEFSGLKTVAPGELPPSPAPASTLNTSGIDSSVVAPVLN